MKKQPKKNPALRFLFFVYCLVMLWLLFGRSSGWVEGLTYEEQLRQNVNLTPFLTIQNYVYVVLHGSNETLIRHCIVNLGGNIFLFIPAGWLLPRLWPKLRNFFLFFLVCTAAIFLVEVIQLFTLLGSFDIDDLILNLFGMTLGYIFYLVAHPKK